MYIYRSILTYFYLFVCSPSNQHESEKELGAKNLDRTTFEESKKRGDCFELCDLSA